MMCGVKLKLCAIILVLHVTKSTESSAHQFVTSNEDEDLSEVIAVGKNDNHPNIKQRKSDERADYEQYDDANDENDKTRKKRQMVPHDCHTVVKCKHHHNHHNTIHYNTDDSFEEQSNEWDYENKLRPPHIWKDQIKKIIHKNFVPYKKCYDQESGKLSNYYKSLGVSSPAENFNTKLKHAYFTTINNKKHLHHSHEPIVRQQDTEAENSRNQYNETVSNDDLDQNEVQNIDVLSKGYEPDSMDETNQPPSMVDSASMYSNMPVKFTSMVSLVNDQTIAPNMYSIGDNTPQDVNIAENMESINSNIGSSDSTNQSSDTGVVASVSNANGGKIQLLPYIYPLPPNNQNKINPNIPKYVYPPIMGKKKPPFVFMPPSEYEGYVPNTFHLPSYPISYPFNSNDKDLESQNSMYQKYYSNVDHPYYPIHDEKVSAPFIPDEPPFYGYLHKERGYQRPKKFKFAGPQYDHHVPNKYISPSTQLLPKTRKPSKFDISKIIEQVSYNPKLNDDAYPYPPHPTEDVYSPDDLNFENHVSTADNSVHQIMPKIISEHKWLYENLEPGVYPSYYSNGFQTVKPVENAECGNGTEWVKNCHICVCKDGVPFCDKIKNCKLRPFGEPMLCKPYSRFKLDDCYECECNGDGVPECTIQDCDQDMGIRPQPDTNKQYIRPLRQKLVEYNNNYQKWANFCPPQTKIPTCEQGTEWISSCHRCKCNENGRGECVKLICQLDPEEYGKPSLCRPNSDYQPERSITYHICNCNDEGVPMCLQRLRYSRP